MTRKSYEYWHGFEHILLEDSYVLGFVFRNGDVELEMEFVLLEGHAQFSVPIKNEEYCYRRGSLILPEANLVKWSNCLLLHSTDAEGEADYGNIENFYVDDGTYYLLGDWGELQVRSKPPVIKLAHT
ncbi:MAG: hypothetical protein RBT75_20425 [Anaerolineae bacterium]|nr:hypothetical protein [Anaerolineae bacterium]